MGAEAEEDTDVRADATLSAGEAERGFEDADAAEPEAERDCVGGKKPRHSGTRDRLSKRL